MNRLYRHVQESNCLQLKQLTDVLLRIQVFWVVTLCLRGEWCPTFRRCHNNKVSERVLLCSVYEMVAGMRKTAAQSIQAFRIKGFC